MACPDICQMGTCIHFALLASNTSVNYRSTDNQLTEAFNGLTEKSKQVGCPSFGGLANDLVAIMGA